MKKYLIKSTAYLLANLFSMACIAQDAGMSISGMSATNMSVAAGTVYVPGGGYFNNGGNVYLGADNIVAASTATITGSMGSRLFLLGQSQIKAAATPAVTQLDFNGTGVDVDVTLANPLNAALNDLAFGAIMADGAANFLALRNFDFAAINPINNAAITDNHMVTNAQKFIIGTAGTLTGYGADKYVVTNDNMGELRKLGLPVGSAFFYPIGRAEADYTPANLSAQSGATADYYANVRNFAESDADENIGGYSAQPNVSRTWLVYSGTAGNVANLDFIHPGTPTYEVNGYDRNNSNVIRYNASGWVPNLPSDAENQSLFGTPVNYWAQQITLQLNSTPGLDTYFGKSNSAVVLPLKLGEFTAAGKGCTVQLNWNTLFEQNLSHFIIQRSLSTTGIFENIGRQQARGNSNGNVNYAFEDLTLSGKEAYYRLAMVDVDGKITYSPIRFAALECMGKIFAYPNPVTSYFTVVLPTGNEAYNIRVLNTNGQQMMTMKNATGSVRIDVAKLAAGTYVVMIIDQFGKSTSLSVVKQ